MINYIRNLKIRLKLYILIGVALIGMFIIGGMSFFLMGRMNDMTNDITTSWLPSIEYPSERAGISYRNIGRNRSIQSSVSPK